MTELRSELRPEDLRIGNWVCENDIFENPAWHHTVIGIGIKESDDIWLSNCDIFKASELYPIPLSEDWLKRFGFEDIGTGAPYLSISQDCRIVVPIKNTDVHTFVENDYEEDSSLGFSGGSTQLNTLNKYVHQLQNLYHSLTGADLKELNKSF